MNAKGRVRCLDGPATDQSSCTLSNSNLNLPDNESASTDSFSDPSEDNISDELTAVSESDQSPYSYERYNIVEKPECISKAKNGMRKHHRKTRLKASSAGSAPTLTDRARRVRRHRAIGLPRHVAQRALSTTKLASVIPTLPAIGAQLAPVIKRSKQNVMQKVFGEEGVVSVVRRSDVSPKRESVVAGRVKMNALDEDVKRVAASFKVEEACANTLETQCIQQVTWSLPTISTHKSYR